MLGGRPANRYRLSFQLNRSMGQLLGCPGWLLCGLPGCCVGIRLPAVHS